MRERRSSLRIGAVICLALVACERAEGPAPVAWDRTRCARCGMLVSEPASAAQRHTAEGEVLHYDDPGCLLVSLPEASSDDASILYFHHRDADRWLTRGEVRFVASAHTPMGYGLAAVGADDAAATALSLEAARQAAWARDRERASAPRAGAAQ